MDLPLITCVCVSKGRPGFLRRAVERFQAQTYPNKDLVIVYEDGSASSNPCVSNKEIKFVRLHNGSELTLGERRNISIQHCTGAYFCQWDDDDWYHNRRLEIQLNALVQSGRPACALSRLILYDGIKHAAYLSSQRYWEGSILCRTDLITEAIRYPHVNRSEDNSLLVNLVQRDYVRPLSAPYLYAYYYHGGNTWDRNHFDLLFQAGYPLDQNANDILQRIFLNDESYEASDKVERLNFDVL